MTQKFKRTHHCGELSDGQVGDTVTLCGWIHTRRDHGGLIFIDLWDKHGLTQVVLNPQIDQLAHQEAQALRNNFVIAITGKVRARMRLALTTTPTTTTRRKRRREGAP